MLGIQTSTAADQDATATLEYQLEATCTTTEPSVCQQIDGPPPTPAAPVRVTWSYRIGLAACFATKQGADRTNDGQATCFS
jgi:hypothetical protein